MYLAVIGSDVVGFQVRTSTIAVTITYQVPVLLFVVVGFYFLPPTGCMFVCISLPADGSQRARFTSSTYCNVAILPVVTKDLPVSPRFSPFEFLSRCKFRTTSPRDLVYS